ncbi:MAG: hypothetical protein BGO78_08875 [Chloroflexi bacterium 44-23]|nr:MAG: hypothetical protein BGO78_08875 [Chloroflexi bacterium 44-23]
MKSKKILVTLLLIIVIAAGSFVVWGNTPAKPAQVALQALASDSTVTVNQNKDLITFFPTDNTPQIGLIFYPGGRVDFRAYAAPLHQMAAQGFAVYLVKMPLNLAVFDTNAADAVIAQNPQIRQWVIAGHSLGGAMAASYVKNNPSKITAVIFWAAYATKGADLSDSGLSMLSISASHDGLSTPADIEANSVFIPADAEFYVIEGGNHAQFANYGSQAGDGTPTITWQEQQAQVVSVTTGFLHSLP